MKRIIFAALVFVWFDPIGLLDRLTIFEMKILKMEVQIKHLTKD